MCGLVGIVTKGTNGFSRFETDAFAQLLYADQLRGVDGTGIFYNSKKNKPHVRTLKAPYQSSIFCARKEFDDALDVIFKESNFAVGHNRAATRGVKTVENTHPFRENHITLVHNGTLLSHKELKDDKSVEVDSHAICHSIAENGAIDTLKKINGAFALIWFDAKEKTLNLCRNYERPLHIIECETCHILVSEPGLGLWIAERNKLKVVKQEEVETKKLYKFALDNMKVFTKEEVEYKTYTASSQNQNWRSGFFSNGYEDDGLVWNSTTGRYEDSATTIATKKEDQKNSKLLVVASRDEIRFRSAPKLRRGTNGTYHLEGDVLRFKTVAPENVTDADYEDEWRVKFFGKETDLLKFVGNKELIATVSTVCYDYAGTKRNDTSTIYVQNVREYSHKVTVPAIMLPASTNKKWAKKHCQCCNTDWYVGEGKHMNGMFCCPDCIEAMEVAGGYVGQGC